ncbi:hypothetical protein [Granulicella paludicola]|uniref:hypothetical protein n=1 Tax=Granulicella paludicola TaxID=474951 RepID=UPI0021DFA440|nr:hypothetical protein [Granulicella paludicola]
MNFIIQRGTAPVCVRGWCDRYTGLPKENVLQSKKLIQACAVVAGLSIGILSTSTIKAQQAKGESQEERGGGKRARTEADLPKGPGPRLGNHPDLSGYWTTSRAAKDKPIGNIGKDLPGYKLPFTPAGEAAHKYNVEHTVDPEALCIVGGLPRHNASGLGFQLLQGQDHAAFLYAYTTYRLVPFDGRKHSEDPDPSFFGEEVGSWDGDTFVIDSIGFKGERTWADENADPHSDQQHVVERWTRPDAGHVHLEMVVNDSKFYTEPIHYQRTWLRGKPGDQVHEYSCSEDNVDAPHLGPGPGVIGADGQRGYEKLIPLPPPPSKDKPAVTSIPD